MKMIETDLIYPFDLLCGSPWKCCRHPCVFLAFICSVHLAFMRCGQTEREAVIVQWLKVEMHR